MTAEERYRVCTEVAAMHRRLNRQDAIAAFGAMGLFIATMFAVVIFFVGF